MTFYRIKYRIGNTKEGRGENLGKSVWKVIESKIIIFNFTPSTLIPCWILSTERRYRENIEEKSWEALESPALARWHIYIQVPFSYGPTTQKVPYGSRENSSVFPDLGSSGIRYRIPYSPCVIIWRHTERERETRPTPTFFSVSPRLSFRPVNYPSGL